MKILSKLSVIACLCWATLASCESPDYETGRTAQVNGLMSVTITDSGKSIEICSHQDWTL